MVDRMTPGWIKSYKGLYSIMKVDGSFTDIYQDKDWNLDMSVKGFTKRVKTIKKRLYKEIELKIDPTQKND